MPKSAIPMGSEFGPNQVDLVRVLELARQHEGDDEAFVILVVTTGQFSRDALIYADDVMEATHLNIVTLDKGDLNTLTQSPLTIVEILNKKARRVMELKTLPSI